jgi:uracil-DNA glycosylase family 4
MLSILMHNNQNLRKKVGFNFGVKFMQSIPDVCLKCGLWKQGHNPAFPLPLPGDGSEQPDIIFCGESLGETEYQQGRPFVGKSGKLLRESIELVDLPMDKIRFTNVVRCRPPDNRTPTVAEIKYCSQFLVDELIDYQPKVVVLLGNTPLKAVLGLDKISSYQGQGAIERDGIKYVPAYHPAYILRNNNMEDWLKSFQDIIEALEGDAANKAADAHYQYLYPETIEELEQMRDELLSDPDELIACDIESISLRIAQPDNKIITIAFANSSKAWSFPIDHKDSWLDEIEYDQIINILYEILTKGKIIGHNIKFDCKMIRHFLDIDFVPTGDTIQLSRLVSPDALEHGLKRLAGIHLGMFDYDDGLQQYVAAHPECDYDKGGTYGNIPLAVILPYGGKDVSATRMLHDKLYEQLTEKQRDLYNQMIIKADYALGLIEENGFKIDYWLVERYRAIYQAVMDKKYLPAMEPDKQVKQYLHAQDIFNNLKLHGYIKAKKAGKKYPCTFEYGGEVYNFDKTEWHTKQYPNNKAFFDELNEIVSNHKRFKPETLRPGSPEQISSILFTYKKLKPEGYTDGGQPSIKRDLLKKVIFNLKENGKHVDEFIHNYMDWKLLRTINGKTFEAMQDSTNKTWYSDDGRERSNYTLGGAKTGRTSSAQPNLQNIPAVEKEPGTILQYLPAKNVFTHTFDGGGLAMLDYSGMELRVMCSIANIQGMIDVFNRKGDVHRYVSSKIYKKPEDQITKFERYRGKWSNWSLLYLGGANTLYRLYSHLGLTREESEFIAKMYYAEFPELSQYHDRIIKFVDEFGYVESVFGRKLSLMRGSSKSEREDIHRTAVNMPIQGVASDTLMIALAIITQLMLGKGYKSMFVNTVHDSIVLDYHPDERDELVELCMDVMENVVDYAAEFMPGLDFSWLKVPLVADVEYGISYGSHGFYEPLLCDTCNNELTFSNAVSAGDEEYIAAEYHCYKCNISLMKNVDPITYNNTNPEAVSIPYRKQQVLLSNAHTVERTARTELPPVVIKRSA